MIQLSQLAPRATFGRYGPLQPQKLRGVAWASSMSAIHRGIHRSDRGINRANGRGPRDSVRHADSGRGDRRDSKGPRESSRRGNDGGRVASTSDWAGFERQARGSKLSSEQRRAQIVDGTISDEALGRMSRRKRFYDPRSTFGKGSLVYRMKFGDLKGKADLIHAIHAERLVKVEQLPSGPEYPQEDRPDRTRDAEDRDRPRKSPGAARELRHDNRPGRSQDTGDRDSPPRRATGGTTQFRQASRYGRFEEARDRDRPRMDTDGTPLRTEAFSTRGRRREHHPISIKYTTAASQFLYGKSVVKAALVANRRKFYNLYILESSRQGVEFKVIKISAKQRGVHVTMIKEDSDRAMLDKMSDGRPHNGYVLEASPLPQPPITALGPLESNRGQPEFSITLGRQTKEELLVNGTDDRVSYYPQRGQKPLVLFLYEVLDPGNLGALLRTAKFLGVSAIVTTKQGSAGVTPVVLRASAGAAEEVPLFTVESPVEFLKASREAGWRSFAAAPPSGRGGPRQITSDHIEERNPLLDSPCILILGSEGQGLPTILRRTTDYEVNIPMATPRGLSTISCLNVGAAGAILCNSFLKIRKRKTGSRPEVADQSAKISELETAGEEVVDVDSLEGSTADISLDEETGLEEPMGEESTEGIAGQDEEAETTEKSTKETPKPDQGDNDDKLF